MKSQAIKNIETCMYIVPALFLTMVFLAMVF